MRWIDVKSKNPEWDFSSSPDHITYILEKNKKIWGTIGRKICDYYTHTKKIPMVYTDYNEEVRKNKSYPLNHLIFLLDESGIYNF